MSHVTAFTKFTKCAVKPAPLGVYRMSIGFCWIADFSDKKDDPDTHPQDDFCSIVYLDSV